jgi:hypothetical protein
VATDRATREKNLFARFTTEAGQLLPPGLESEWEVLSVMQHHGVPTRIMDWATSLFVALYFALEYKDDSPSPCIWVLNPFNLNQRAVGKSVIFDRVDRLPKDAYKHFIAVDVGRSAVAADTSQMNWPSDLPVATAPIWGHPRALRQHGVFTVHGKDERALEVQSQDVVQQVEIPTELQEPLRELLKEAGIHHYCVFPDLDGLARRLRQRYGWR